MMGFFGSFAGVRVFNNFSRQRECSFLWSHREPQMQMLLDLLAATPKDHARRIGDRR